MRIGKHNCKCSACGETYDVFDLVKVDFGWLCADCFQEYHPEYDDDDF